MQNTEVHVWCVAHPVADSGWGHPSAPEAMLPGNGSIASVSPADAPTPSPPSGLDNDLELGVSAARRVEASARCARPPTGDCRDRGPRFATGAVSARMGPDGARWKSA